MHRKKKKVRRDKEGKEGKTTKEVINGERRKEDIVTVKRGKDGINST